MPTQGGQTGLRLPTGAIDSNCNIDRRTNLRQCQGLKPADQVRCIQNAQYIFSSCANAPYPDTKSLEAAQQRVGAIVAKLNVGREPQDVITLPAPPPHSVPIRGAEPVQGRNPQDMTVKQRQMACAVARGQLTVAARRCDNTKAQCAKLPGSRLISCRTGRAVANCNLIVDAAQTKFGNLGC